MRRACNPEVCSRAAHADVRWCLEKLQRRGRAVVGDHWSAMHRMCYWLFLKCLLCAWSSVGKPPLVGRRYALRCALDGA